MNAGRGLIRRNAPGEIDPEKRHIDAWLISTIWPCL
jgi:hypothetical protein